MYPSYKRCLIITRQASTQLNSVMTRTIVSLVFALALTSCSLLPQVYDNNEYQLLAQLETRIQLVNEQCSDTDTVRSHIPHLVYDAELLHTYTFYIPKDTEVFEMSTILRDDVRQFEERYQNGVPSLAYCKLKTKTFLLKVRTALKAVAKKKRI